MTHTATSRRSGEPGAAVRERERERERPTGEQNEDRLRRRLWNDRGALAALHALGLRDHTIRRFRLGLKEPYLSRSTGLVTERALAFPVHLPDGTGAARWSFLPLEGVTRNALHPAGWAAGAPRVCHSRPVTTGSTLLIVPTPVDMWLLAQTLGDGYVGIVVGCPSHPGPLPSEWSDAGYWRTWSRVVLGLSDRLDEEDLAGRIARRCPLEMRRAAPPTGGTWSDLMLQGGSAHEVQTMVRDASVWRPSPAPAPSAVDALPVAGEFQAEPIEIEGAFVGGNLHHVVTLERRDFQDRAGNVVLVQRYVCRILRSDGRLLDVEPLPAPPGTPRAARVFALSDGTRVASAPAPGRFGSWRYPSIREFVEARGRGDEPVRRNAARILADIEAHLRSAVWMPEPDDYALLSLFVLATFVHRVFDALPIVLVNGPRGSGKSELGQAIASASMNGLVVGRTTAPGLVRLLAESRGTVVLDDLERIGAGRGGTDDVSQILKVSYKRSTARRISPGRDGRVEVQDFFSPKVITNISGCDPVLLTRVLAVTTRPMSDGDGIGRGIVDVAALRDEAHVWAMCEAAAVDGAYRPLAAAARTRDEEIAAPLRALAAVAGRGELAARLERALARSDAAAAEPVEAVVRRAAARLVVEEGATSIAMPRLLLEMALAGDGAPLPSPESLGRLLLATGVREDGDAVDRRRLHGEAVRIYRVGRAFATGLGADVAAMPVGDPFGFCVPGGCGSCRYSAVCAESVPGLRSRNEAGRGR